MNNELAIRKSVEAEISGFEMKPRTLDEAMKFCDLMAKSDIVPKAYQDKPGNIMVAIQMGAELGLTPMRALRSIAVINGRATMWGDDVLAMVLASPVCEYVDESDSTDKQGVCKTKRKGCAEQVSIFTLADATRAGLLGKQGPWQTNTSRMLKLRARGFGLRDTFADVLAGLVTVEEALDIPRIEPDDPATNILEAAQPLSLKDKLKAKVELTDKQPVEQPDPAQTDGVEVVTGTTTVTQQAHDASAPQSPYDEAGHVKPQFDPAEPYRIKLRTCERTPQAITHTFNAIPEEIRQDVFQEYQAQLKSLGKKK